MKIKKILMATLCSLALLACGEKSTLEKETLIVGTNAEYVPFEYLEGNKIVGFDIDLLNEISQKIGKKVEIKNMSFDGLIPALQTNKIDLIIAGMAATEKRKEYANFSDSYYNSQLVLVTTDPNVNNLDELVGEKIGVILGYTGDILMSSKPEYVVERFNAPVEAVMALQAQKIKAAILDDEPAKRYASQHKELILLDVDAEKEEYAIALRKEDTELLEKINKALEEIKAEGTYEKLYNKYF